MSLTFWHPISSRTIHLSVFWVNEHSRDISKPSPAVPPCGTRELFTKIVDGTSLESRSTWGRAVQRSVPRLERVSGAFALGGHSLNDNKIHTLHLRHVKS